MSAVVKILGRLSNVWPTGPGRWICRCPAHQDRSPSLSIRELEDGRVLVNDFGGCPTEDVLAAIGLSFADLFDKPIAQRLTPVRRPFDPMAVLQAVAHEITVVVLIAGDVAEVDRVDEAQRDRLHAAARRLNAALEAIGEVAVPDEIKRIRRAVAA